MARTYAPIPAAGRLRLPAAVVHPDDPLPKTWRVYSAWTYRGQRGAWLMRASQQVQIQRYRQAQWVQIVYQRSALRRSVSHVGKAITTAARQMICVGPAEFFAPDNKADVARRREYYAERGIDVRQLDDEQKARQIAGAEVTKAAEQDRERQVRARAIVAETVGRIYPSATGDRYEALLEQVWRSVQSQLPWLRS
jgi:hypothetical protein